MIYPEHRPHSREDTPASGSMKQKIALFSIVALVLVGLVAMDRAEWLHLRPASGVAMALSHASD